MSSVFGNSLNSDLYSADDLFSGAASGDIFGPSMAQGLLQGDYGNLTGESDRRWNTYQSDNRMLSGALGDYSNAIFGDEGITGQYRNDLSQFSNLGDRMSGAIGGLANQNRGNINQLTADASNTMGGMLEKFSNQANSVFDDAGANISEYSDMSSLFQGLRDEFSDVGFNANKDAGKSATRLEELSGKALSLSDWAKGKSDSLIPQIQDWLGGNLDKLSEWRSEVGEWGAKAEKTILEAQSNLSLKTAAIAQANVAAIDAQQNTRLEEISGMDLPEQVRQSAKQVLGHQGMVARQTIGAKVANEHEMANFQASKAVADTQMAIGGMSVAAGNTWANLASSGAGALGYASGASAQLAGVAGTALNTALRAEETAGGLRLKGHALQLESLKGEMAALGGAAEIMKNSASLKNQLAGMQTDFLSNQQSIMGNFETASLNSRINAESAIFQQSASLMGQGLVEEARLLSSGLSNIFQASLGGVSTELQGYFNLANFHQQYQGDVTSMFDLLLGLSTYNQAMLG